MTGKQITDLGGNDIANGIALQSNGKIVLTGQKGTATSTNFALARYNTNGTLDTSFAGTGKIVACGRSNSNLALASLTSAGALDSTFNSTGKVSIDFGGNDTCKGLAIQPTDGKYVLAGWTDDGTKQHWALARVLP